MVILSYLTTGSSSWILLVQQKFVSTLAATPLEVSFCFQVFGRVRENEHGRFIWRHTESWLSMRRRPHLRKAKDALEEKGAAVKILA